MLTRRQRARLVALGWLVCAALALLLVLVWRRSLYVVLVGFVCWLGGVLSREFWQRAEDLR